MLEDSERKAQQEAEAEALAADREREQKRLAYEQEVAAKRAAAEREMELKRAAASSAGSGRPQSTASAASVDSVELRSELAEQQGESHERPPQMERSRSREKLSPQVSRDKMRDAIIAQNTPNPLKISGPMDLQDGGPEHFQEAVGAITPKKPAASLPAASDGSGGDGGGSSAVYAAPKRTSHVSTSANADAYKAAADAKYASLQADKTYLLQQRRRTMIEKQAESDAQAAAEAAKAPARASPSAARSSKKQAGAMRVSKAPAMAGSLRGAPAASIRGAPSLYLKQMQKESNAPVRITEFKKRGDTYTYVVQSSLVKSLKGKGGGTFEASFGDFHNLHVRLLSSFPEQAGSRGGVRTLPDLPEPIQMMSDVLASRRVKDLDRYCRR